MPSSASCSENRILVIFVVPVLQILEFCEIFPKSWLPAEAVLILINILKTNKLFCKAPQTSRKLSQAVGEGDEGGEKEGMIDVVASSTTPTSTKRE